MSITHCSCKHKTICNQHHVRTSSIFAEVSHLNVRIIEILNLKMNDSISNISLMDKLKVLIDAHTGSTMDDIAEEMDVCIPRVPSIISQLSRITKCSTPTVIRRYLPLKVLKVICGAECGEKRSLICSDFGMLTSTFHRIIKRKEKWKNQALNRSPLTIRRA